MSLERQTSPSDNFRNAFMGVNLKYVSYYGEKLPYDATEFMLQQITGEYFTTGIEFFVNGQNDPYLKDLGETAVEALTQNLVHF